MSRANRALDRRTVSGVGFMLLGATLIQWTAALVIRVFPVIGPSATSAWRFLLGAIVLLALTRPHVRHWTKRQWLAVLGKRTPRHLALVALAGVGVVALTRPGNGLNA